MAIAVVNRSAIVQNTAADPQSFSGFTATTVGNLLVAIITIKTGATNSVSSVTGGGGTWTRIGSGGYVSGSSTRIEIWANSTANASLTSLSVDLSSSLAASCVLYELSGADMTLANIQNANGGDSTSDTAWNSGPLTPTAGDYFLIAGISTNATAARTVSGVTAGWSAALWLTGSSTIQSEGVSDQAVTANGSTAYSCAFTGSASQTNGWNVIAIPVAAAGPILVPLATATGSALAPTDLASAPVPLATGSGTAPTPTVIGRPALSTDPGIGRRTPTTDFTASATTHTVTKPTGLADGDAVYIGFTNTAGTITGAPSGFTQLAAITTQTSTRVYLYRKVITNAAGEGAWTFTSGSTASWGSVCECLTGVDQTTPEDTAVTTGTNSTGSDVCTVAEVTTVTAGAQLLYGVGVGSSTSAITPPSGMTEAGECASGGRKAEMAYEARPTPGATGSRAAAAASSTLAWSAWMVAVRPFVSAPMAAATGQALVPTVVSIAGAQTVVVPLATATGAAATSTERVIAQAPTATASGQAATPVIQASAAAPTATATGSAATPTERLVAQVPTATATGSAPTPTERSLVAAPVATATGQAYPSTTYTYAPTATASGQAAMPTVQALAAVPTASASGSAGAPTVQALAAVPAASGTGAALAPTERLTVLAPTATASGQAYPPAAFAYPPTATASGQAIAPTVAASVPVPSSTATASAATPTQRLIISVPVATATADAYPSSLLGVGAFSAPLTAVGTATAASPTVAVQGVIPSTAATAAALTPTTQAIVAPPLATVAATAYAPSVLGGGAFVAPPTATGVLNAPAPAIVAQVPIPLSTGSGTALAPLDRLIVAIPVATASAQAVAPTISGAGTFVQVPTATGSAQAASPTIAAQIAAPAATGTADASPLTLRIAISAPLVMATATGLPLTVVAIVPIAAATGTATASTPSVTQAGGVIPIPVIVLTMPGRSPLAVPASARMPLVVGATAPATVPERGEALIMPKGVGVLTGDE